MADIYTSGEYLNLTDKTWHSEDSKWKARQISKLLKKNKIEAENVVDIGCGAGRILFELYETGICKGARFSGYDISPQAISLCPQGQKENLAYYCQDFLQTEESADLLMAIDVFEHVPDYLGFLETCRKKARLKVYHIPLDLHVSALLRNSFLNTRKDLGHLHYFTADSALASLKDTGHEILDVVYTNGSSGVFKQHPSIKTAIANIPRFVFGLFSVPLSARLFGGYSLLVLAK